MTWSRLRSLTALGAVVMALASPSPAWPTQALPQQSFDRGLRAVERGAFEDAVTSFGEAARLWEAAGNTKAQAAALMHLARAHAALGQYRQAVTVLESTLDLVDKTGQRARVPAVLAGLGNASVAIGALPAAETYLTKSLAQARQVGDAALTAAVLNDLGNLFRIEKKYPEAVAAYRESVASAQRAGDHSLVARALINESAALRDSGAASEAEAPLDAALDQIKLLGPSHDAAFLLVGAGIGYRDLRGSLPGAPDRLLLRALGGFADASSMADGLGDRRIASYGWGYLGALYEDDGQLAEALRLTHKAVFAAQQANAPESLYRWQWQAGRLLRRTGATDEAIASYRRAIRTLQGIRPELAVGYGGQPAPFRDAIGPVYFQLVDLLLQRAAATPGAAQATPLLVEARETVELFKAAELRDYFRDDCVDTLLSKTTGLDVVSKSAVAVYPILLPDRIELLVSLPTGLKRVAVPVTAAAVTREVRDFRRLLEKRTTREYLPHARQLYDWLVRPLEPDLASVRIDTLVFVPDGPLRTIPMAALHDGKQFLVQKYALAITPGLNLTDPRPVDRRNMKVLAVGVTEAVQGFPALPNVSAELDSLRTLFGSTTLVDKDFVVGKLERELKDEPFTIVHVASHGHFGADVGDTFLLTFDGKLTMDRLDQLVGVFKFREEPLDLLTLSACDTAESDDRAALGLAGVAVKAGARSAVATLWDVNDRVSADLVAAFYQRLKDPSESRADALRRAQLEILANPRYDHPGFWAPFLLINNWL